MLNRKVSDFFIKYEPLLPLIIFCFFLASSLPGISWGAPALWNPDELVWRVDGALRGDIVFDVTEPDFNYPSLPKYVMYAIGYITYGMGKSEFAFIVAARVFSAFLGALGGVMIYYLARLIGAGKGVSFLAGVLYVVSGVAAENGRFAHNDLYLQLFTILCVYCIIKYQLTNSNAWLYCCFLSVGLAASCKYTGGSLILAPIIVFLVMRWKEIQSRWLSMFGVLFLGGLISYIGYGIGTPIAFVDPFHYFPKILIVLNNLRSYGFNAGTQIGLYGQWPVFKSSVGIFAYYLFIFSSIWSAARLILWKMGGAVFETIQARGVSVFILVILIFDLPYLISINYIERYFIPFVPFLSILGALFLDDVVKLAGDKNWKFVQPALVVLVSVGMIYSVLRLVSISLLFMNDARIPATQYIASIKGYGKGIEYTLYPPDIDKRRFLHAHNYPIYFVEWAGDTVPTGGRFEYNLGEKGLLERNTDYFVIDSFTYNRFYTQSICDTTPVECDFFKNLIDGQVASFRLLKSFTYRLPSYLPPVNVSAVNPDIMIFERAR